MRHSVYGFLTRQCLPTIVQLAQIQSHLTVTGEIGEPLVVRELSVRFAIRDLSRARALLRVHQSGCVSCWNTVIRVLAENHRPEEVLLLAKEMVRINLLPDNYSLSFILKAAGGQSFDITPVSMYHSLVIKLGFEQYDYVRNGLIHCYANCESMNSARAMFDASCNRDVISWTTVIHGYLKIGDASNAQNLFDEMPEKNFISWSAMINGYAQMGMFNEALITFNGMLTAGIKPTYPAMAGALSACTHLGDLLMGKWIHSYIHRLNMKLDVVLGTALIDMYAKCGCINIACKVFHCMPQRDVYAYTSLILGLAEHGEGVMALQLFSRMLQCENVKPNKVTFLAALTACCRMGFVEEGLNIFRSMKEDHGISPGPRHYCCLVDLLGRGGLVEQADMVVKSMLMDSSSSYALLGALLNACKLHDVKKMIHLGDEGFFIRGEGGVQVLVSNIFASENRWDDVQRVREGMQKRRVKKVTGSSSLQ